MTTTLLVHGNAAQVQQPTEFASVQYTGPGLQVVLKAGQTGWVHIPLPSPDVDGVLRLVSVWYNVQTDDAHIDELDIYDGSTRVYHENKSVTGEQSFGVTLSSAHDVEYGISLSLRITYPGDSSISNIPQTVVVNSASAEYDYKIVATQGANPPATGKAPIKTKP